MQWQLGHDEAVLIILVRLAQPARLGQTQTDEEGIRHNRDRLFGVL